MTQYLVQTYSRKSHAWRNRNCMVAEKQARKAYARAKAQAEVGHYPVRLLRLNLGDLSPSIAVLEQVPGIGRLLAAA
jgi:hypothetical protein